MLTGEHILKQRPYMNMKIAHTQKYAYTDPNKIHIDAHSHTHTHTHKHTHEQLQSHIDVHTCIHTYTHTCIQAQNTQQLGA